jgi:hypothetical protein
MSEDNGIPGSDEAPKPAERGAGGRFAPGNKVGPGRKQGSRHHATILLEKMMADDGEEIVRAVIDAAKGGDMAAARLILDRIAPPAKDRTISVHLPPVESAADVVQASAAILQATATGELSPNEGTALAGLVEQHRKSIEMADIAQRLSAIEERLK